MEVRLLKETARRFADDSLRAHAQSRTRPTELSPKAIRAFAELGLGLVALPKDMGGLALGPLAMSLVSEALAGGDVNAAFALPQPDAFGEALVRLGRPLQRARFGHPYCIEPERTWGSFAWGGDGQMVAARLHDRGLRLTGSLPSVWHLGRADRIILVAQLADAQEHVAAVLPLPYPGVTVGEPQQSDGLPLSRPASLTLRDVVVPEELVLGGDQDLAHPLSLMFANFDLRMASLALGTARAASSYVLSFAEQKRQAGTPLAHFQSMGFLLVDMHLACETALKRVREAASAAQASALSVHGHKPTDLIDLSDLIAGIAAARAEAEEVAFFVTDSAVQILDDGHEDIAAHPISAWHHDVQSLAKTYRRPTPDGPDRAPSTEP